MFDELYKGLNPAQKEAVDAVEGPVMVVAGPGTGKTHILTLRIANILRKTQARPSQILALTFTDSAARTMRRRLADIVGEAVAREVMITTFHGFCEYVLTSFSDHFDDFSMRRPMGDVEQVLLWREVIDTTGDDVLRPPKSPYANLKDLMRLFEDLIREGISSDAYRAWGEAEALRITSDPEHQYVRGAKQGELKKSGQEKIERLKKVAAAADLFDAYDRLKEERGVYDFGDMVRVVVRRIEEHDALRATLQETYQYILADEHQDANAVQHRLLELFAYDEHPNIFVVGDEKQAIYRFQGANLGGFKTFTELFPRTTVVTLTDSFRSLQGVLDTAHTVIEETGEHARLQTTREADQSPTASLSVASDPLHERDGIASAIKEKITQGVLPHEIAVIARKNETADQIARHLEAYGIPTLRAGDISLTSRPIIRFILALMAYSADPTRLDALRPLILAPWWEEDLGTRMLFLAKTRDGDLVKDLQESCPSIHACITENHKKATSLTPIEFFSYILETSGARTHMLSHEEHLDDVPLVRLLMMHIEDVSALSEDFLFRDVVAHIEKAHEHDLSVVKRSVTEMEGMVTVITAHKAKGMEFKHVFIPDLIERSWEKGGKAPSIPSPLVADRSFDDARRLLYVAMTRAEDHIHLSYAGESKEGRERRPSVLIPGGIKESAMPLTLIPVVHDAIKPSERIVALTRTHLTHDGIAPTGINEYLTSPALFFAHRILKMHEPPTGPLILGSAVHKGIAALHEGKEYDAALRDLKLVFTRSLLPRNKTFDDLLRVAEESLTVYRASDLSARTPAYIEKTFEMRRMVLDTEVLIKGKVDGVFETPRGLVLVDFKTGSTISEKDDDAVRQLMLYSAILKASGHPVNEASLIQVTKDVCREIPVSVTEEKMERALGEADAVIGELLSGKWRKGEPSDYDVILLHL